MYQVEEFPEVWADACIRESDGRFLLISLYGRDGSLMQLGATALIQGALAMNKHDISSGIFTQFLDTSALPMARVREFPLTMELATQ